MIRTLPQQLRQQAAAWAERRHGRDAQAAELTRRRIYILPTGFGLSLALLLFAMLLGSLNYDTSLGFALTFLLTGVSVVAMHHCHGNLMGLELRVLAAAPVHAGQRAAFQIAIHNPSGMARYDIVLQQGNGTTAAVDLLPGETRILALEVPTTRRGWIRLPRFGVHSRHPGKLFHAWSWVNMDSAGLVYPTLAPAGRVMPTACAAGSGDHAAGTDGEEDFVGLRAAAPGDPPHRIAWKAYARSDQLLLKQFAGALETPCLLDWASLPDLDAESRLEQLARWCVDLATESRSFGLSLPNTQLPVADGNAHLHRCLSALALYPDGNQ
jgi:uncharacterized protein (DUF58 family)